MSHSTSSNFNYAADITGTPGGATTQVQFNNAGAFTGSSNFVWDNTNGYLGVNMNPTTALSVSPKAGSFEAAYLRGNAGYNDVQLKLESYDYNGRPIITFNRPGVSQHSIAVEGNDNFYFGIGSNLNGPGEDLINMAPNGNVAIGKGITAPNGKLDVKGSIVMSGATSGYAGFRVPAAAGTSVWQLPSADGTSGQALVTNGSGVLSWNSMASSNYWTKTISDISYTGGNVGIGTATPSATLDVAGFIIASGSITGSRFITQGISPVPPNGVFTAATNSLSLASNSVERVRIDSSGNVGIGTTAPTSKLDVKGGSILVHNDDWAGVAFQTSHDSSYPYLSMRRSRGTEASPTYPLVNDILGAIYFRNQTGNSAPAAIEAVATENQSGSAFGGKLRFDTTPNGSDTRVTRMTINEDGNVGIGTTVPTSRLQVESDYSARLLVQNTNPTSNSDNSIILKNYRGYQGGGDPSIVSYAAKGWPASPAPVEAGMVLMSLKGNGFADAGFGADRTGASIEMIASGNWGNSVVPTDITFRTGIIGDWATYERMRILSNGNIGIGVTAPTEKLEVSGNVKATSFISTSDARLKKNIVKTPGLDYIRKLTGVQWQWKADNKTDAGVIAQDVERVMPFSVITDSETGFKAVKYNTLIAPLIESTKELDRSVASVATENARLNHEVEKLKAENQQMRHELDLIKERLGIK